MNNLFSNLKQPAIAGASIEHEPSDLKHVVIVGGGFAGLNCARALASRSDVRITLLEKNNYT
ncbi:FAD-dependent oxidoreductase [Granulicella sp. WH15]|uniref:FAD-dependent oxidoreductase n=1 Tax=Granulicella sp. WH15 TaxID=2602070 RepID=UPI001C6FE8AF|nr:FAD-dependent oxidoreductase [Granulicella sp. WH15]